jgi:hypothetical protein
MRQRDRLWILLAPLFDLIGRPARAQPNTNTPSTGPGRETDAEVQAGAGTQGDVTTGSSGAKTDAAAATGEAARSTNDTASSSSDAAGKGQDASKADAVHSPDTKAGQ